MAPHDAGRWRATASGLAEADRGQVLLAPPAGARQHCADVIGDFPV